VDTSEVKGSLSDYKTLNEFFSRRLRPGARPIFKAGWAPAFASV
jgi:phosphatidylserine decarboxylase